MNFLGIGPFELLLILVIATVVLGPERMARAGRVLGRLYAQYRYRWQKDVDEMTRELRRELEILQQEMDQIRQTTEAEIRAAEKELKAAQSLVAKAVEEPILAADKDRQTSPAEPKQRTVPQDQAQETAAAESAEIDQEKSVAEPEEVPEPAPEESKEANEKGLLQDQVPETASEETGTGEVET